MRRSTAVLARALLVATLAIPLMAGVALGAHEPPRFGLTPVDQAGAFFELTIDPGETRRLEVELANFGHDEAEARTYAADVYSVVGGGFGAELFGDESEGTTLWLDYESQTVTLEPRDAIVIDFSISVPDGTPPGEYVTGLVVENAVPFAPSPAEGGIGVAQVNRSAIAVAIDVPGERQPALDIGDVGHHVAGGLSVVTFEVVNSGNVHLAPAGTFVLRSEEGDEVASSAVEMDSVYAGTSTTFEAPLASALQPGDYCAELGLTDEETGAADATDCQPFTVSAEGDDEGQTNAGAGPGGIPIIQPMIDAAEAGDVYPVLAGAALLAGLVLMAIIAVLAGVLLVRGVRGRP